MANRWWLKVVPKKGYHWPSYCYCDFGDHISLIDYVNYKKWNASPFYFYSIYEAKAAIGRLEINMDFFDAKIIPEGNIYEVE